MGDDPTLVPRLFEMAAAQGQHREDRARWKQAAQRIRDLNAELARLRKDWDEFHIQLGLARDDNRRLRSTERRLREAAQPFVDHINTLDEVHMTPPVTRQVSCAPGGPRYVHYDNLRAALAPEPSADDVEDPSYEQQVREFDAYCADASIVAHEPSEPTAYLGNLKAAQQLAEVYFAIAADEIGEDEVLHRRDKRLAAMAEEPDSLTIAYCSDRDEPPDDDDDEECGFGSEPMSVR